MMAATQPTDPAAGLLWPSNRFGEALQRLLARTDAAAAGALLEPIAPQRDFTAELARWVRDAARGSGFEGVATYVDSSGLWQALDEAGPHLVVCQAETGGEPRALAALRRGGSAVTVIRPDGQEMHLDRGGLCDVLAGIVGPDPATARIFDGLPGGGVAFDRLVRGGAFHGSWFCVVRYTLDASAPLLDQLRAAGSVRRLGTYLAISSIQAAVAFGAAWTLGDAAVTGRIDLGRIGAWGMLALSNVPLQYISSTLLGRFTLDFVAAVKKRLLNGIFHVSEAEVRGQSFSDLVARLNEAGVVEQSNFGALTGGLSAGLQIGIAFLLFAHGVLPGVLVPLLTAFVAVGAVLAWVMGRRYRLTYAARLALTKDLVEKIVGHRTRAVQDDPEARHDSEDESLSHYARLSERLDRVLAGSYVFGRLWLVAAALPLLAAFTWGAGGAGMLASSVAVLLAYRGLGGALAFSDSLMRWLSAWWGIRSLFFAGRRQSAAPRIQAGSDESGQDTLLSGVSFRYRDGGRTILSNASLRIEAGERVLVEGPSGGGKSTLAKLLAGEMRPTQGTILVEGIDRFSVPESRWREHVAASPQFHENYVFSSTFGFNVDPKAFRGDLTDEALAICAELGLDDLLAKMPSGPGQLLGDTGRQLSHGERTRLFIARSLLQDARLLVFDESFAGLDPESLLRAVRCVRRRARTLFVVAHT